MKTLIALCLSFLLSTSVCFATVTENDVQVVKSVIADFITADFCGAFTDNYFTFLDDFISPKSVDDQIILWNLVVRTWREELLKQSQIPPDNDTCQFYISVLGKK